MVIGHSRVLGALIVLLSSGSFEALAQDVDIPSLASPPTSLETCDIAPTQTARVVSVLDAVTVELSDGATLRLEGLGSPRPPARAGAAANWPIRERGRAYTAALVLDEMIEFAPTEETDRYGRIIAQVYFNDGTWLNGALLRAGFARVETQKDQVRCFAAALLIEAGARDQANGMWALSTYAVRSPEESVNFTNDFQIVEGVVRAVAEVRGRIFLNFGEDWRTDFTVTIAPGDVRRFADQGLDPLTWANRSIRVRGWLELYNGPMIEADHPEQVELLSVNVAPVGNDRIDEGNSP